MPLMDKLRRKRDQLEVHAPVTGRRISLDEVPDAVFADRILGDGFAVEPTEGVFRAPIAGELVVLAATGHAFAVRAPNGLEVLVHVGLDTVELDAGTFTAERRQGDAVAIGDVVVRCDLDLVRAAVESVATPVVVTNGQDFRIASVDLDGDDVGPVMTVTAT